MNHAKDLLQRNAYRCISALFKVHSAGDEGFRGIVNLGRAVGIKGRNSFAERPGVILCRRGLATRTEEKGAWVLRITDKGKEAIRYIQERDNLYAD
jgi:hypothetical protein